MAAGGRLTRDIMPPIRLHLGPLPPMLRTMIRDLLSGEPDMLVVGDSEATDNSMLAARAEQADLVITHERAADRSCLGELIRDDAPKILAISPDGESGKSVRMMREPYSLSRGNCSSLAQAIRQIVGSSIPSTPVT